MLFRSELQKLQFKINEELAEFNQEVRDLESNSVFLYKSYMDNMKSNITMPFLMAISYYADLANNYLFDNDDLELSVEQSLDLSDALINKLRPIYVKLFDSCSNLYSEIINAQKLMSWLIFGISIGISVLFYVVSILIIQKAVDKTRHYLSFFAFITAEEIKIIISISKNTTIKNYNRDLPMFEQEKDYPKMSSKNFENMNKPNSEDNKFRIETKENNHSTIHPLTGNNVKIGRASCRERVYVLV